MTLPDPPPDCRRGGLTYYGTRPVRTDLRRRTAALLILPALALALGLAGCGTEKVERSVTIGTVNGAPGFTPFVIIVNEESHVTLDVRNTADKEHGFTIEGYRRSTTVAAGQTKQIKFKATRGGTFKIFCQLHPAHQTATLVVQ